MDAGQYSQRIEILDPGCRDGYATPEPTLVRRCWAKVMRSTGHELGRAGDDMAELTVQLRTRWSPVKITRKMVVRMGGFDYEIDHVDDVTRAHESVDIFCVLSTRKVVPV